MMITRMALPRRTFLRGMGATLALPLLDCMVPALSAMSATAAKPVRRLGCVYLPNGANMAAWMPTGTGTTFDWSPTLAPLAPFRDRLTVTSGLDSYPAESWGDGGGDHNRAPATWLNATHPKKTEGADIRAGTTIDQIVAQQLGAETQLASLEMALERSDMVGACSAVGYSCVYSDTISWRTPTTPLPMENNPRTVFERMFGDGTNAAERLAQMRLDRSILDTIAQELGGLRKALGPADRRRVAEYLDAIRDVERRIQKSEEQSARDASSPTARTPTSVYRIPITRPRITRTTPSGWRRSRRSTDTTRSCLLNSSTSCAPFPTATARCSIIPSSSTAAA